METSGVAGGCWSVFGHCRRVVILLVYIAIAAPEGTRVLHSYRLRAPRLPRRRRKFRAREARLFTPDDDLQVFEVVVGDCDPLGHDLADAGVDLPRVQASLTFAVEVLRDPGVDQIGSALLWAHACDHEHQVSRGQLSILGRCNVTLNTGKLVD